MNKLLLIEINPKAVPDIRSGQKIFDLQTWHPTDFIGWVYLYSDNKVFARFWFDVQLFLKFDEKINDYVYGGRPLKSYGSFLNKICLTHEEILAFGKTAPIFAWRINNKLEMLDPPIDLKKFKAAHGLEEIINKNSSQKGGNNNNE